MTDQRTIPDADLLALADGFDIGLSMDGDEATLTMSVPHEHGRLHLSLVATRADGRPSTLEAYEGKGVFGAGEFYLPVALVAFGFPGLPIRVSGTPVNPVDLLPEALLATGEGRPGTPGDVEALRGIVRAMVEGLGFVPADWIDLEVLDLLACATETSREAYEALTGSEPLRDLCRAFPMLAGEITTCTSVLEEEPGVAEFEAMLVSDGLDLDGHDCSLSLPPLGLHLVRWLRGLAVRTPLWEAHAARLLPKMLAGMRCGLPTDVAGFEAMLRAQATFQDSLSAAWDLGSEEQEQRRHGRLTYLADGIMAAGGDWDEVHSAWMDYGGRSDRP